MPTSQLGIYPDPAVNNLQVLRKTKNGRCRDKVLADWPTVVAQRTNPWYLLLDADDELQVGYLHQLERFLRDRGVAGVSTYSGITEELLAQLNAGQELTDANDPAGLRWRQHGAWCVEDPELFAEADQFIENLAGHRKMLKRSWRITGDPRRGAGRVAAFRDECTIELALQRLTPSRPVGELVVRR